jgi:CRP-like cAMP-binding protein
VLDRLTEVERAALFPELCVRIDEEGDVLFSRGRDIEVILFPVGAIYSVIVELSHGDAYEVDVLGRNGVAGSEVLNGEQTALRTLLCQASGPVVCVKRDAFERALSRSPALLRGARGALRRQWFAAQQTVACNAAHTLDQRAARWILLTHEEIGDEQFSLRAEYLSLMLGVPPDRVVALLDILRRLGCIELDGHEHIRIVSRTELLEQACECFNAVRYETTER